MNIGRWWTHQRSHVLWASILALLAAGLIEVIKYTSDYSIPLWIVPGVALIALAIGNLLGNSGQSFPSESAIIALTHRDSKAKKQYYERAFSEGDDILYVTIMSENTMKRTNGVTDLLKSLKPDAKLRVLTWYSQSNDVIKAFHQHLGDNHSLEETIGQVDGALTRWRKLKLDYPTLNFNVKVYESTPTMQGTLVRGKWALIEPLPYHVGPYSRPGIILTQADAPKTLEQFWKVFDQLYENGARALTSDWPPAANSMSATGG